MVPALVDYTTLFSKEARELKQSALADLVNAFQGQQDVVTLHAGLPSSESFPLTRLHAFAPQLTTANPATTAEAGDCSSSQGPVQAGASQGLGLAGLPMEQGCFQVDVTDQLMHDAQQYMFHAGHPPLLRWAREFAAAYLRPPNPVDCAITSGAVNALACAIACLCDAGDYVIVEEFAYTHAAECVFIPRGLNLLPVAMDEHGMRPDSLEAVLRSAPVSPVTGKPPRVLYIIPSGQNPTGAVMPLARKQQIYDICRRHGIIILEDDAYYWLQYPQGDGVPESQQLGLQLPASFLSLDTDSRVLRIDTFSKLLGPGYRLGWVTGARPLVAKLAQSVQAGSCGACSLSQVVVSQLLEAWGMPGFEAFVRRQQALYARRAAVASRAAARHLAGLASWQDPSAGMFMWFKLTGLPDVDHTLTQQLVAHRVVVIPGRPFWNVLDKARAGAPCPYFRVTFGSVPEERIDAGFERLAAAIRAAMALQDAQLAAAVLSDTAEGTAVAALSDAAEATAHPQPQPCTTPPAHACCANVGASAPTAGRNTTAAAAAAPAPAGDMDVAVDVPTQAAGCEGDGPGRISLNSSSAQLCGCSTSAGSTGGSTSVPASDAPSDADESAKDEDAAAATGHTTPNSLGAASHKAPGSPCAALACNSMLVVPISLAEHSGLRAASPALPVMTPYAAVRCDALHDDALSAGKVGVAVLPASASAQSLQQLAQALSVVSCEGGGAGCGSGTASP